MVNTSKTKVSLNGKNILLTGAASFIGANLIRRLLRELNGSFLIGVDNLNNYYDIALKEYRLQQITEEAEKQRAQRKNIFLFQWADISDRQTVEKLFREYRPSIVINLAAQAGVRYSIENPNAYIQSNIIGFYNILESCRHSYDNDRSGVQHLIYAFSSSVYGGNTKIPSAKMILWTIPHPSMLQPRNPMSCWLTAIPNLCSERKFLRLRGINASHCKYSSRWITTIFLSIRPPAERAKPSRFLSDAYRDSYHPSRDNF